MLINVTGLGPLVLATAHAGLLDRLQGGSQKVVAYALSETLRLLPKQGPIYLSRQVRLHVLIAILPQRSLLGPR